jgi:hypothetical protein
MDEELVINQQVWVSDFDNAQDHYQAHNLRNKGNIFELFVLAIAHIVVIRR